jgi:hypothetical protein
MFRSLRNKKKDLNGKHKKGKVVHEHNRKAYRGVVVQHHSFLTSALDAGEEKK